MEDQNKDQEPTGNTPNTPENTPDQSSSEQPVGPVFHTASTQQHPEQPTPTAEPSEPKLLPEHTLTAPHRLHDWARLVSGMAILAGVFLVVTNELKPIEGPRNVYSSAEELTPVQQELENQYQDVAPIPLPKIAQTTPELAQTAPEKTTPSKDAPAPSKAAPAPSKTPPALKRAPKIQGDTGPGLLLYGAIYASAHAFAARRRKKL